MTGDLPSTALRVGVLQARAKTGDVEGNARRAADLLDSIAAPGVRVAVLPELHLCAYDLDALAADQHGGTVAADGANRVDDLRLEPLVDAAVRSGRTVLTGAAVRRADGALTNSVLMVDPLATVSVVYDKEHLWQLDEAALFTAGQGGGGMVQVDDWQLGVAICYDMSFPEHARQAALSGAHAYLCPSAFAAGAEHRAAVYLAARALENTVYSVFTNPVGGPSNRPTAGDSAVFAPDGTVVARAQPSDSEQTVVVELDPGRIERVRGFLHMLAEEKALRQVRKSSDSSSVPY
ncbi:carbon-nitrogen hydrolase family protein [Streptomyces tailanensis]|uniref:carbon-nitrogen hydrolase family protein n=1 Tax=Streptomyces tailanensis TaxID=2569858 RepID=UPI00122DDB2E|nr:carbon-nitrogen hydrolase family protein [Streptomyces tailanensis]